MILFLDTNILIEFVEKRRYSEIVFTILDRCSKSDCHLYMSVGGFYTITYLIDRHLKQEGKSNPERLEELKSILKFILTICDVASLSKEGILSCLNGNEFVDLEDGYQFQSALGCGAEILLTLNKKDFANADKSLIKVLTPDEFIESYFQDIPCY